jgi:hypothetical protein
MKDLTDPLFHFLDLLETHGIPYALIGGLAVSALGRERFTKDVDFTISIDESQAKTLEKLFKGDPIYKVHLISFISSPKIPDMFRIFWRETPVDLLVANTDFQKEIVQRALSETVAGRTIKIATPEDLIVLKLLADRPQDQADISVLLKRYQRLDWAYIEKWCRVWEIEDRLKALRSG